MRKPSISLPCFDTAHFSRWKTKTAHLHVPARKKTPRTKKPCTISLADWLKSLHVTITIEDLNTVNLPRATQLLNKTNQMNLSTRRLSETELWNWSQDKNHQIWTFRVQDDIDDSGLTGLISIEIQKKQIQIIDFILSCRVFGRMIENAMLAKAIQSTQDHSGVLIAEYQPTPKNKPCLEFWQRSGFIQNEHTFTWDLKSKYQYPDTLTIKDVLNE